MTLASTVQNTSWVATLTTSSDMQDFHEGAFHHANNRRGGEYPYIGKATNTQWDGVPDLAFHPASGNIAHMYWTAPVKCTELKLKNLQGYRVPECGSWVKVKVKNMASNKDVAELQFNGGQWSGKADTVYDVGAMDVGDKVDFGFDNVNDYTCDNARLRFVLECTPLPSIPSPPPLISAYAAQFLTTPYAFLFPLCVVDYNTPTQLCPVRGPLSLPCPPLFAPPPKCVIS